MNRVVKFVFLGLLLSSSMLMADDKIDVIKDALKKIIPHEEADSIESSVMPGFYEVTYGAEVLYVSEDGRFLLSGSLYDIQTGDSLTESKRAAGRLRLISEVDREKMVIYSPKEVKHVITVFTDIDCPYCRRMHAEMAELNSYGIEIRYLFFPRAGLNSKSYKKAVSVWCAKDRLQALTDAKAGKSLPEQSCDNPITEHMALVEKMGITGTPTMILEDGEVIPGYIPAARLNDALKQESNGK